MFVRGEDTLLIRYAVGASPSPVAFTVRFLTAFRNIHSLTIENNFLEPEISPIENGFTFTPYRNMPTLYIQTNEECRWYPVSQWYKNFEYIKEQDRGFAYREDLYMPGAFEFEIPCGGEIIFRISTKGDRRKIAGLWADEEVFRKRSRDLFKCKDEAERQLWLSSGDFIIRNRKEKLAIVAGYHWFYEWGRDTLISLPGLTFHSGRINEGIEILDNMGNMRKRGLIPNNVSEKDGECAYNSADASLWYFWCVQELLKCTGSLDLVMNRFWSILIDIAYNLYSGAAEHIRVLENGLVAAGSPSTQLTWMDTMVDSIPVTPRNGCPVEINALWFNALCFIRNLAHVSKETVPFDIDGAIERIKNSFDLHFWIPEKHYLADRWMPEDDCRDESMRPNQIMAVSLPFAIVTNRKKASEIVKNISKKLLTPFGLRTLSPDDPDYRGCYAGCPDERDAAYHQGTVWPWLLGHYGDALLKTAENKSSAKDELCLIIKNIKRHIYSAGVGHISEIFGGDSPFKPCGCIAQAWSIAEVIRLQTLIKRQI
jgi:predicted glycogen debranching enzyme